MHSPSTRFALPVTALLLSGALAAQTPSYKAELVGGAQPGWTGGIAASALNDDGLVVGNTTVDLVTRPFYGTPGSGLQLLPLPDGTTWANANDVNASGLVVGQVLLAGGAVSRAAVWQPGTSGYTVELLPAGTDGQFPFDARGVNDRGDVVGKYGLLFNSYVWNATDGVTKLAGFPDYPEKINNARQTIGGTYRVDLDTLVVEDLGNPTGTGFNYIFSDLWVINDAGECGGYGNVATGQSQSKQAVRYSDGTGWTLYNVTPLVSANVMGISAAGDTAFQLGTFGRYVSIEGHGSVGLQSLLDPAYAHWDVSGSFAPRISRGGLIAVNGLDTSTNQGGIALLTPLAFEDLGGGSMGALGTPVLGGYGSLAPSDPTRLRLAAAAPGTTAFLLVSVTSTPVPFHLGTLHANPVALLAGLPTDALGRVDFTFAWPTVPSGTEIFVQYGVLDGEALTNVALSNALRGLTR